MRLCAVIYNSNLKQGFQQLDEVLSDLGLSFKDSTGAIIGAKTELEKFDEFLSNPNVAKALDDYAARLGITAEKLREILRLQKEEQMKKSTRPRVVGEEKKKDIGFGAGLSEGIFGTSGVSKIESEADYIKGVYQDLGATAGDVISQMIGGAGQLLETWILTGEASGAAMAQMAASVISGLVVQAGVKAIFETAEGFAAAARYDFVSASGHFTAAKIYGAVALASLGTGLAIGAAGGLQGGKGKNNQQDQPDYYTQNPNNDGGNLRQFNGSISAGRTNLEQRVIAEHLKGLSEAVEGLRSIVKTSSPGDVLVNGSNQRRGFIAQTATTELVKNPTQIKKMQDRKSVV